MSKDFYPRHSQLFTVRLWREELGNGQSEWRGQVQHIVSGEMRYFREWPPLEAFLLTKLQTEPGDEPRFLS